jgi:hypothetical protein
MTCNKFTSKHTASTCRANHDTCVQCSRDHWESVCTAEAPRCANCQGKHVASDHSCPRYLEEVKKIWERVPDNRFPLFPEVADLLTWIPNNKSAQNKQGPSRAGDVGGWRTVGPRRTCQPGFKTRATDQAPSALHSDQSPSLNWAGRLWSCQRPERTTSPLQQQMLHKVLPLSILRTPTCQCADSLPANALMSLDE